MEWIVFGFHPPAEWVDEPLAYVLLVTIILAGVGTTILFVLGLFAYWRRKTLRYLLITVALFALVARSVVGLGTIYGYVPMPIHHLVEHGLDFLIAAIILYAVYRVGPPSSNSSPE